MPGTAYVLFHHVMGETDGQRGVWGYVRGGMGGLTQALARAARDLGVEIRCEAPVARIAVRDGRVTGVVARERRGVPRPDRGEQRRRQRDLPAAARPRRRCPPDFRDAVSRIAYESASLKINVALSELPSFTACPGTAPGPQHRGTIHICPDLDYIERAYDDAKYGRPSERPGARVHDPLGGGSHAWRRPAGT